MSAVVFRSEPSCHGGPPVEWIAALPQETAHEASSSNGADHRQLRNQGDVTLSRPDLGGFEWTWEEFSSFVIDGGSSRVGATLRGGAAAPPECGAVRQ
jgi:hypothetical protein